MKHRWCTCAQTSHVAHQYARSEARLCLEDYESSKGISVSTDGGFFKTFDFSTLSGRSCDSVSLPLSAVHDPFTDTVFSAAIVHQDQPPFDLGPHSSAGLIINALKGIGT